jgi:uncharacterized protein YjeT (DUF2065 family)
MSNKLLLAVASTLEAVTGLVLVIAPSSLRLLLGTDVSGAPLTIARVTGFGLLSLGVACWPCVEATLPALRAMLAYNCLVTSCLFYLQIGGVFVGRLLVPAFAIHTVLTLLLVRAWLKYQPAEAAKTRNTRS